MEDGTNSHTKKGLWTEEEDRVLLEYVNVHGRGRWNRIPKLTGLKRCGKSCRLRWLNYLSPNIKRGDFSEDEEDLIVRLHNLLGNRWSLIAGRVPGRTDNQVKNHWNTHLSKKLGLKQQARKSAKCSREHTIGNAGAEIHNPSNNNKFGLVENNKLVTTTEDPLVSVCSDTTSNENASEGVRAHPPQLYDHHDLFELDIPIGFEYLDGHYSLDQIWDRV